MKKKILFVINTLSRAGAETALLELLAQLAAERGEDRQPRYELWSGNTGMCSCTVRTGRNGLWFLAVWH